MKFVVPISATDAMGYLQNAEISETNLKQVLIEYAGITPNQVHFYIGLCADVVRAAKQCGTILNPTDFATSPEIAAKSKVLINRLLQYANKEIEYAIHALSACRISCRSFGFWLRIIVISNSVKDECATLYLTAGVNLNHVPIRFIQFKN